MSKLDPEYLKWLRSLPCCAAHAAAPGGECFGPIEAHHETGGGLALKAPDARAIPLCLKHHRNFHDAVGVFKGWPKAHRKDWQRRMVAKTQAAYAAREEPTR